MGLVDKRELIWLKLPIRLYYNRLLSYLSEMNKTQMVLDVVISFVKVSNLISECLLALDEVAL